LWASFANPAVCRSGVRSTKLTHQQGGPSKGASRPLPLSQPLPTVTLAPGYFQSLTQVTKSGSATTLPGWSVQTQITVCHSPSTPDLVCLEARTQTRSPSCPASSFPASSPSLWLCEPLGRLTHPLAVRRQGAVLVKRQRLEVSLTQFTRRRLFTGKRVRHEGERV
jgi:hypothetical protein